MIKIVTLASENILIDKKMEQKLDFYYFLTCSSKFKKNCSPTRISKCLEQFPDENNIILSVEVCVRAVAKFHV